MKTLLNTLWMSSHRRQLIVSASILGACTVIAIAASMWAHSSRSTALFTRDTEQAAWSARSTASADLLEAESALPQHEAHALQLLEAGFTTPVDRVSWAEGVVTALNAAHPAGYTIEIGTAQQLPLPEEMLASYTERGLTPPEFEVNDLSLKVQGLTEGELTSLLATTAKHGNAIVRIEHCHLQRRIDGQGLDTECSLRRYRIRSTAVESGS